MLVHLNAAKCVGINATRVSVEIDIALGIGIHMVGLPDASVKESLLRTTTALQSLGYHIPGKKIVINLAPADIHKSGGGYDLPIAVGIIACSGQIQLPQLDDFLIMGELGLDGAVHDIPGGLIFAELARDSGLGGCILPLGSALEAAELEGIKVYGVQNLDDVLRIITCPEYCDNHIVDRNYVARMRTRSDFADNTGGCQNDDSSDISLSCQYEDFADIIGQEGAKRGAEIAAAGGHNLILIGSPGSGKSSLAKAIAGILPPMTMEESLQTSKIYSVAGRGRTGAGLMRRRPFRAPHYTASLPALLGGGSDSIMPGEVSLAHNGVLFADEFCEAPQRAVEALRAPLEDRKVTISRLKNKIEYPASFMLVAATNPCPCGYWGDGDRCTCAPGRREAYLSKLSGPVMDRIDLQVWVRSVSPGAVMTAKRGESSQVVAARVKAARDIQAARFRGEGISTNAQMSNKQLELYCPLTAECRETMNNLMENMGLSMRAYFRIIKVARTIADLAGCADICPRHLTEAAGFRFLDKKPTGSL